MTVSPRLSVVALVLANLVPLVGVIWLGWRVLDVLLLYWAENVIVGCVNVLRMLATLWGTSAVSGRRQASGHFLVPFFVVHYGIFCYGHYIAVVGLFADGLIDSHNSGTGAAFSVAQIWQAPMWIGVAAIAASHLLSFWTNFIGQGEYRRATPQDLMHRPYGRIVVLHLTVIAGGIAVSLLGDAIWMLGVLVAIKTAIDLRMHSKERDIFLTAELRHA